MVEVKSIFVDLFPDDTANVTIAYRVMFGTKSYLNRFVDVPPCQCAALPDLLRGILTALDMLDPGVDHDGLGTRHVRWLQPEPISRYYIRSDRGMMKSIEVELLETKP